jgi:hypothetical protein
MPNPYETKGPAQFWRSAVADPLPRQVRPIPAKRFTIPHGARIATAGSCFAQEVAKVLVNLPDIEFLQTEPNTADQPMFSALYGNVYTVRQLRQLCFEAFGLTPPLHIAWQRNDGRWVDAHRPAMFPAGFQTPAAVAAERETHLAAVRRLFTECSTFIFTLGLTEAWISSSGDTVFPIAPGVVAEDVSGRTYRFHNFTYDEVLQDLGDFLEQLHSVNPTALCILTVSPVPLVATYTDEHVLVATTHSKSILRAVCSAAEAKWNNVFYFPSYEIISSHYNHGAYYDSNKRTIARSGVQHVMDVFQEAYFGQQPPAPVPALAEEKSLLSEAFEGGDKVICDEELVEKSFGF